MSGNTLDDISLKAFSAQSGITIPVQTFEDLLGAVESLKADVERLGSIVVAQGDELAALQATQDTQADNELNMLRLINDLRKKEPGKVELSRAEKIEKCLESRPDHKASFETLRGYLGIDNDRLGKVIRVLVSSGKCAVSRTPGDKRKRSLILLPK